MKTCTKCELPKPLTDFNKRSASRDGLQAYCRACSKGLYKTRYETLPEERERILKRNAEVRERTRACIREAKDVPCKDCGVKYPFYVMQFDHIYSNKDFNISSAIWGTMPIRKVLDEIAKCEVVCANCHAERTYSRKYGEEELSS